MTLPTLRALLEKIGDGLGKTTAAQYHTSKTFIHARDKPVAAYGIGYAGGVFVYLNGHGQLDARGFAARPLCRYNMSTFYKVQIEDALAAIKNKGLFAETGIDESMMAEAKEKHDYKVIGKIKGSYLNGNYTHTFEYNVKQFKNGKYFAEQIHSWGGIRRVGIKYVMEDYKKVTTGWDHEDKHAMREPKLEECTISKVDMERISMFVTAGEL